MWQDVRSETRRPTVQIVHTPGVIPASRNFRASGNANRTASGFHQSFRLVVLSEKFSTMV